MPIPLILDVDTGVDDLVALLLAVTSPEVDLIGVGTVTGNVHVEKATRNTLLALEIAGAQHVEVARGASQPLEQPWESFTVIHGEEGLGGFEVREPEGVAGDRDAATLIVDRARERPGEVLLVAVGPLTNVALAARMEPALPELLGGFALMGGAFREGGNVTPRAEANVWMDPEAAEEVFEAWAGAAPEQLPRCLGLDVTERVWLSQIDIETVCAPAPRSELARLFRDAVTFYADFYASTGQYGGACMHDSLALIAAMDPAVCTWMDTRVQVELDGRWTRGETVTDLIAIRNTPWSDWPTEENARVATTVDARAVVDRIMGRLRSLVEAQG